MNRKLGRVIHSGSVALFGVAIVNFFCRVLCVHPPKRGSAKNVGREDLVAA